MEFVCITRVVEGCVGAEVLGVRAVQVVSGVGDDDEARELAVARRGEDVVGRLAPLDRGVSGVAAGA